MTTKILHTEIEIGASAETVWQVLTDFDAYATWNPFIRRAKGTPSLGQRLEVRIEPPGGMGMTFRPKLLSVEPARELRWLGHFLVPGLFDGEHRFAIEPLDEGRVRFTQEEQFSGLLVPLFARSLDRQTLAGFEAMNRALKERAEAHGAD